MHTFFLNQDTHKTNQSFCSLQSLKVGSYCEAKVEYKTGWYAKVEHILSWANHSLQIYDIIFLFCVRVRYEPWKKVWKIFSKMWIFGGVFCKTRAFQTESFYLQSSRQFSFGIINE